LRVFKLVGTRTQRLSWITYEYIENITETIYIVSLSTHDEHPAGEKNIMKIEDSSTEFKGILSLFQFDDILIISIFTKEDILLENIIKFNLNKYFKI